MSKMRCLFLVVVVLFNAVRVVVSVDCTKLGFGTLDPRSGSDLPVCAVDALQCCTPFFIGYTRNQVTANLTNTLNEEYNAAISRFAAKADKLFDYFDNDFIDALLNSLPVPENVKLNKSDPKIADSFQHLRNNFVIRSGGPDSFDTGVFYQEFVDSVVDFAVRNEGLSNVRHCVKLAFTNQIKKDVKDSIAEQLKDLRRALSALKRVDVFLESQRDRLENATILDGCVEEFISTAFCRRCVERTPPLCLGTCNALLRGCFSPYYTALKGQYAPLWVQVKRIVEIARDTVTDITLTQSKLVDNATALVSQINHCLVNGEGRTRRDIVVRDKPTHGSTIPADVTDELSEYTGAFLYDKRSEGLLLCSNSLLKGTCLSQGDDATCQPSDMCTSQCHCYDGVNITTDEHTNQVFDRNGVDTQGGNPVFNVSTDILQEEVERIGLNDPIAEFLESEEFKSVMPRSPDMMSNDDGDSGGDGSDDDDNGSSAHGMMVSCVVIFLSVLVAL
jgi:hypothetical protein